MGENVIAIDCGTQSVRALVFDPRGNLLAKEKVPIEPYFSNQPGWAEQDPLVFWNALCKASQSLLSKNISLKDSLSAISLTSQRASVVNLDKQGNPLQPAIIWLDQRRADDYPKVGGYISRLLSSYGCCSQSLGDFLDWHCGPICDTHEECNGVTRCF